MEFLIILGNSYLVGGVMILFYLLYWITFGRFQRSKQFNGPAIVPFVGHYKDLKKHNFQLHLMIDEYYKKFGKLFSFHYQNTELKVVSDSKMIHEILVKRFDKFCNRKFFIDLPWPCHQLITMIRGPKWKYIRNLLSSLMTTVSLKKTINHFSNAATTYANKFSKAADENKTVDLVSHSQGYLMEILLSMAFSIDSPNQSDFNKVLVELSSKFNNPPIWVGKVAALPFGNKLVKYLPCAYKNQLQPFIDTATKIVAERKISTEKKEDILQILLDIQNNGPSKNGDILNNEDILAQGIALLTAVHSQTSTTLAFITYYLAKNLDVQKKMQQEIDSISNDSNFPNWEHLTNNLQYMDSVIKEVLRLHPSSTVLTRECTKTNTINGIEFKEGDAIAIPIYSIQRDNEIWENAVTFNPERFDGSEKPNAFFSHGIGPRMCIGPRMARLEIKMALCKLLRKHTILLQNPNQKLSIHTDFTVQATTTLTAPIYASVLQR